jgi:hypothetical protein
MVKWLLNGEEADADFIFTRSFLCTLPFSLLSPRYLFSDTLPVHRDEQQRDFRQYQEF